MSREALPYVFAGIIVMAAVLMFGQFAYWTWVTRQEEKQRELARRLGTLQESEVMPIIRMGDKKDEPRGIGIYLESLIVQAGNPYTLGALFQRVIIAGVVGLVGGFVLFRSSSIVVGLVAGMVFASGLSYLPIFILKWQAESRLQKITEQLPDALDLLARSLQAGHGISEGMRTVAEEMSQPIGPEFGRVFEEHNLGRDLREAFLNLSRRYPRSFDIKLFSSSVLLQRDTGGNLVEILQGIASTIRNRFVFQGKVQALTSEARFTAFVLGGLPFMVMLLLSFFSPQYLKPLVYDPLGILLSFGCICSFSIGVYIMRELAKVEV